MTSTPVQGWTIETPVTPWSVVLDGDVVVASGFCGLDVLAGWLGIDVAQIERVEPDGNVAEVADRYLAGDVAALDEVKVRQPGATFMQDAWHAMREIPAGETWSYAELATKAGRPDAVRAAGTACATNKVAPFVPCHRVIRSDGSLGGYAYGLDLKRWLLDLEHRNSDTNVPAGALF